MKYLFFSAFVAVTTSLVGCDEGEIPTLPPRDSGAEASTLPDSSTTNVVRTVETRNPFGDTTMSSNLMVDGDFELTGRTEQMPWVAFTNSGQGTLNYATGGMCKSGVRCATVAAGTQLIGYFASPKTGTMSGSLWIRPDNGNCGDVQVAVIDLNDQSGGVTATFKAGDQDAAGWCSLSTDIPNMADKQPVIYISPNSGMTGVVRVDDGVILPTAGTKSFTRSNVKLSSVDRDRVRFISDWVRTHRRFDAPTQAHEKP